MGLDDHATVQSRLSPARRRSPGRPRLQAATGALTGFLTHPLILALSYRTEHDPTDIADWRSLQYLTFGSLVAALSVILGAVLAWRPPSRAWEPRLRLFWLGLMVGTTAGLFGGILTTLAIMEPAVPT